MNPLRPTVRCFITAYNEMGDKRTLTDEGAWKTFTALLPYRIQDFIALVNAAQVIMR